MTTLVGWTLKKLTTPTEEDIMKVRIMAQFCQVLVLLDEFGSFVYINGRSLVVFLCNSLMHGLPRLTEGEKERVARRQIDFQGSWTRIDYSSKWIYTRFYTSSYIPAFTWASLAKLLPTFLRDLCTLILQPFHRINRLKLHFSFTHTRSWVVPRY